jgi:acetoacetyl-CoA synthetase
MTDTFAGTDAGTPELLWQPDPQRVTASRMAAFRQWLHARREV